LTGTGGFSTHSFLFPTEQVITPTCCAVPKKTTLIDTVDPAKVDILLEQLRDIPQIDYLISNKWFLSEKQENWANSIYERCLGDGFNFENVRKKD
jgi:hypothetical protein